VTITRRGFLGGAGLTGILAVLAQNPLGRLLAATVRAATDGVPSPGPLTDHEVETLRSLGQVLIPSSISSKDGIDGILKQRAAYPASATELRAAVAFLDTKSFDELGLPFAALDLERRRRLVGDLLRPYTTRTLATNPYYYLTGTGRSVRRLWSAVAKPLMVDFYASPLGWRVVGYSRQPGECSNLTDYQFPPA